VSLGKVVLLIVFKLMLTCALAELVKKDKIQIFVHPFLTYQESWRASIKI
jgi:hypothetical protein